MSEQVVDRVEDESQPGANGGIVHWMEPRPLTVGPAGISAAAAGAFALGVATSIAVLALMHWLGPQRELPARPRRWT